MGGATTHILSHSLHYGSGVFEGIRCYQNPETKKSYVFRCATTWSACTAAAR